MDCSCNCFGIAASSKKPVKRYNLLVPDIFPKKAPPFAEHIDPSTERKLKKLYEYLEKNLHRGPKVSRRLARRVNRELAAQRWGYVQIAVAAYVYLLEHLREADSTLFAKEIICQQVAKPVHFYHRLVPADACLSGRAESESGQDSELGAPLPVSVQQHNQSVVGVLLNHPAAEMQTLGATLLAAFTRQQVAADYLARVEAFVPTLCQLTLSPGPVAGVQGQASPDALLKTHIACLRALQEQIRLCVRASTSAQHLDQTESCLLAILTGSGGLAVTKQVAPVLAMHKQKGAVNGATIGSAASVDGGPASAAPKAAAPAHAEAREAVAFETFQDLSQLAKSPAEAKKFVECLLRYVDAGHAWSPDGRASDAAALVLLQQVFADEQQQYQAFTGLLRHIASPGLSPQEQLSVAETAARHGLALPSSLSAAALMLAVKELAPLLAELQPQLSGEGQALQAGLLSCVRALAGALDGPQHLLEALGAIASKMPGPSPSSAAVLEAMEAAALALPAVSSEAAKKGRAGLPQALLQELLVVMVQWKPPEQAQAHLVLQAVLGAEGGSLREPQAHALLSSFWHQVAQQSAPGLFVALGSSLAALVQRAPAPSLPRAAQLAASLQAEAALADGGRLGSVSSGQRLAVLLLANWLWACLGRRQEGGMQLEHLQLPLQEAPHLRLESGGLVQTNSSTQFAAADDEAAAAVLTSLRAGLASEERQARLRSTLAAWAGATPSPEQGLFVPQPLATLLPRARVGGPWFGGGKTAASEEGPSGRPTHKLRALVKSRTTDQLEQPAAPGIHNVHDLIAASLAEAQRSASESPAGPRTEPSQQAVAALAAVDALLAASGDAFMHPPSSSKRDQPSGAAPAAEVPGAAARQAPQGDDGVAVAKVRFAAPDVIPALGADDILKLSLRGDDTRPIIANASGLSLISSLAKHRQ